VIQALEMLRIFLPKKEYFFAIIISLVENMKCSKEKFAVIAILISKKIVPGGYKRKIENMQE